MLAVAILVAFGAEPLVKSVIEQNFKRFVKGITNLIVANHLGALEVATETLV